MSVAEAIASLEGGKSAMHPGAICTRLVWHGFGCGFCLLGLLCVVWLASLGLFFLACFFCCSLWLVARIACLVCLLALRVALLACFAYFACLPCCLAAEVTPMCPPPGFSLDIDVFFPPHSLPPSTHSAASVDSSRFLTSSVRDSSTATPAPGRWSVDDGSGGGSGGGSHGHHHRGSSDASKEPSVFQRLQVRCSCAGLFVGSYHERGFVFDILFVLLLFFCSCFFLVFAFFVLFRLSSNGSSPPPPFGAHWVPWLVLAFLDVS